MSYFLGGFLNLKLKENSLRLYRSKEQFKNRAIRYKFCKTINGSFTKANHYYRSRAYPPITYFTKGQYLF
ncbi:hypothetical protein, partial [Algibacter sp.]|uniref:hypothetical protein n=1 Tax=Algibacter sp. TaxID=1872428 RepID=UPI003C73CAF2